MNKVDLQAETGPLIEEIVDGRHQDSPPSRAFDDDHGGWVGKFRGLLTDRQ